MVRYVDKLQKTSRSSFILYMSLGILFLGLLILFIYSTSQYPLLVVITFLSLSAGFFLMPFWFRRYIRRIVENNGWSKPSASFRFLYFLAIEGVS